jgi:hypothetical protein
MKRIAIAVFVVVLVFAVAIIAQTPAKPQSGSVEKELIKLENGWNDAWLKRDLAFLDKILSDDYLTTDFEGTVLTKAQALENLKSGVDVVTAVVTDNWNVRVYGDAAVVMGRNTAKSQYKSKDSSGQYQWTDTWIKKDGRWQCVASQGTKIVQK